MGRNLFILIIVGVVSLWSLDVAYSATLCVNPSKSPPCFSTIQAAEDAASAGDVIVVSPHPDIRGYRESVSVDIANLTIQGTPPKGKGKSSETIVKDDKCPKTVISVCEIPTTAIAANCASNGFTFAAFDITANGVTIKNFTIQHANPGVDGGANNITIDKVCFIENGSDDAVNIVGNNAKVSGSFFRGNKGRIIDITGDDAEIHYNVALTNDRGILISGTGAHVEGNTVKVTNDEQCLRFSGEPSPDNAMIINNHFEACRNDCICYRDGSNAVIRDNVLTNCRDRGIEARRGDNNVIKRNIIVATGNDGIRYDGNNPTISENTIISTDDDGIDVFCQVGGGDPDTCTGGLIEKNYVEFIYDEDQGIEADGNKLRIHLNKVSQIAAEGIDYTGDMGTIYGNTVERAGTDNDSESGIEICGSNNMITDNKARFNSFAGIRNEFGDDNVYRDNVSEMNGKSGINIEDGDDNIVDDNNTLNNHGEGISNASSATDTDITNNVSKGNYTDICNDGSTNLFSGNNFTTGGTGTACVVEK